MSLWWRAIQSTVHVIVSILLQLRVYGRENIPAKGGFILASNHQSYLDPVLLGVSMDRKIHFMARRSLFRIPLFGVLITSLNAFPIERNAADMRGIREALKRLQDGEVIVMFPEGTRSKDGSIGNMKAGIAMIAGKAGVPIVPALIEGSYRVLPRCRIIPTISKINVVFGKPKYLTMTDEHSSISASLYSAISSLQGISKRKV